MIHNTTYYYFYCTYVATCTTPPIAKYIVHIATYSQYYKISSNISPYSTLIKKAKYHVSYT